MKSAQRPIRFLLLCALLFAVWSAAGEPNEVNEQGAGLRSAKAAVITCHDMVDEGLLESIKRRTNTALEQGADYLIYDIDTFGGGLFAAYEISDYLLHEINAKANTVAYVSKKAISAGALISVACEDIIMKEKTRIGDCAPMTIGGKLEGVEREKIETDTRTAFETSAEHNHYPPALLKAMVTQQIEVYRIKNTQTQEYEFFEGDRLPNDANSYDFDNKELIDSGNELLTLTASQAVEYGVARAQVKDLQGVLGFLAERDGVTFIGEPVILRTNWSEEMVRWLNSPAVMAVLVMLAMLGLYIEMSSPGLGLPGLVAVVCVVTIVGSKYLIDMANWVEMLILVVGVLLLMVEIFVLPGFGVAGFLGILCILAGLFGMLVRNPPGEVPWPDGPVEWDLFAGGAMGLLAGFAGFVALAWLIARYLPHIPFLRGLILSPNAVAPGGEIGVSMTSPPSSGAKSVEIGQRGEVVSPLRPAGKARFGESIVDVVAVAEFIEKGVSVEIIGIHGNRVVVRAAKS
jgi:membrane-bound serine protease (ClpP class)